MQTIFQHNLKHLFAALFAVCFLVTQTGCVALLISKKHTVKDRGALTLTSTPPNADIEIDGVVVGKTPMTLNLKAKGTPLADLKQKTVTFRKENYAPQTFTLTPNSMDTTNKNFTIWVLGLAELVGGITVIGLGSGTKDPSTSKTTESGSSVATFGVAVALSGLLDMGAVTGKDARPLGTTVRRTYKQTLNTELESLDAIKARQERERVAAENFRLAQEATERKRQADWDAGAPARAAAVRLAELDRQQEADRRQKEEKIRLKKELEEINNFIALGAKRREEGIKAFASYKEGDKICAKSTFCKFENQDNCLMVSAFIEKWNTDKSKFQIRIETVHNTDGVTYLDADQTRYVTIDNQKYKESTIIWIDPKEGIGTIWVSCKNK